MMACERWEENMRQDSAEAQHPPEWAYQQELLSPVDLMAALLSRADALLEKLDLMLPAKKVTVDFEITRAAHWRSIMTAHGPVAQLHAIEHVSDIQLADLQGIDRQKQEIVANTQQFIRGFPANDVLLTGARGTGKSSLIKACLNEFADEGLRVIEVDRADLSTLPEVIEQIRGLPYRFVVFCDDLSFEAGEPGYKALKVVLDGALASRSEQVLVYATSNRRHLLPQTMLDNQAVKHLDSGEVHPGEGIEEKVSLSERFGLWLSFHPFTQEQYLIAVEYWLKRMQDDEFSEPVRRAALQWALNRGSRSGRVAAQFARDWMGKKRYA